MIDPISTGPGPPLAGLQKRKLPRCYRVPPGYPAMPVPGSCHSDTRVPGYPGTNVPGWAWKYPRYPEYPGTPGIRVPRECLTGSTRVPRYPGRNSYPGYRYPGTCWRHAACVLAGFPRAQLTIP
eukprot:2309909-Rhodomonas_salina.1